MTVIAELRSQKQDDCSKFINLPYKLAYYTFIIKMDNGIKNRNERHFMQYRWRIGKERNKNPATVSFFVFAFRLPPIIKELTSIPLTVRKPYFTM